MTEHLHTYYRWEDDTGTLIVAARPRYGDHNLPEHAQRINRDTALFHARTTANVELRPCPCGEDGFARYAHDRPNSRCGKRYRRAEIKRRHVENSKRSTR